ncbi:hypothetical protein TMatcc_007401 [Talaromyces marneffei ATCC 18224]|uniref:Uncharacterized protein n=2 Tax=Talaromyces marneffei TaxID=37727 RepID=B6QFS9_TALMQ|nr:uncharacterized protein EYB26_004362 [Talaromyces marneffei]EEA24314.1 conserved hypothetical protein [Talaromyces marneffei ATCC 18224]KAE8553175.1 hypothetical protein EYB25_004556 [Talaromyces marneffei]QGA16694.1 hypothetical protein EYB26_004362 [Talaromyces marneffei]
MAQNAFGKRLFRSGSGLQQTLSPLVQRRCQSTKTVPAFTPSSSPELDQKLDRIRTELFVPMYFAEHQKRLIFRDRYRERLNQEQVKITIGNEEFALRPMNRQSLPSKREVHGAIEAMKTSQDWKNFVPLLIGSLHSKYKPKPASIEKWVRLAGKSDTLPYILEAAKQSSKTGFSFADRAIAFRFAFELHEKAKMAAFSGEALTAAFRYAEQAAQLMERPEHTNNEVSQDAKRQPFFIGLLTELSAARAIDQAEGEDVDGKVLSYTRKLLGVWDLAALDRELGLWYETDKFLQEIALIYSGLKMAQQVKSVAQDKTLVKSIEQRLKQLKTVAEHAVEAAPEQRREQPTLGLKEVQSIL